MSQLSVIGKRFPRLDAVEKVTGDAKYITDLTLPRMLCGRILRSPYPHAKILNINTSKAERLPGVKAVITAEDTPKQKIREFITDHYPLAVDKVRFVGDDVAAVAAIDEDTAEEALELIDVDYEVLPAVFDPLEAMRDGAPKIHDADNNIAIHLETSRGDIEKGFAEAEYIFEDTFKTPMVQHGYLETVSCIASYDSSGKFTLWTSTQDPYLNRLALADYLKIPASKIRVIQTYIGGSFGGKIGLMVMPVCALLARKAGLPVKLTKSRGEEFTSSYTRTPMVITLKTGVSRDKILCAKEATIVADNGAYSAVAPAVLVAVTLSTRSDSLYRYKNVKNRGDLVYTNKMPSHAFRGFGNTQMTFAVESQLDIIADKLGIDPIELRLKNATRKGDVTIHGWQIRSCGLGECIQKAEKYIGWKNKRAAKKSGRGVGVACLAHVSGNRTQFDFDGSSAIIKVNEDGTANVITGEIELGQGCIMVFAQIVAEELGIPVKNISVSNFDSDISPYAIGPHASRTTHLGGNAVKMAAIDARRQILKLASKRFEANARDLAVSEGKVYLKKSPEKSLSISEIIRSKAYSRGGAIVIGKGVYDPDTVKPDNSGYGDISGAYTFGAHIAEVEVDIDTGLVKIINYAAAHDLGRIIDAIGAEGQVHGALVQGLGFAFMEELVSENGKILNDSFTDYKILTSMDTPNIGIIFVESNDPRGPYGAKSLGEPPLVAAAPTIANAIYNAIGVRIKETPITPEKILKALRDKA